MRDFSDFTEASYQELLKSARERYAFEAFGSTSTERHVLWRHDIDLSVHRAVRLAEIEQAEDVKATYFVFLHSPFYNALEHEITERIRRLAQLGHEIGLHFWSDFYGTIATAEALADRVREEAGLLASIADSRVSAFSFHNPDLGNQDLRFDDDEIAGLVNAYGRTIRDRYSYVSDSNGYWRFRRLADVVAAGDEQRLHVLTHPEWWQAEPMAPRDRVVRCVEGRAQKTLADYDAALAEGGRENVGS